MGNLGIVIVGPKNAKIRRKTPETGSMSIDEKIHLNEHHEALQKLLSTASQFSLTKNQIKIIEEELVRVERKFLRLEIPKFKSADYLLKSGAGYDGPAIRLHLVRVINKLEAAIYEQTDQTPLLRGFTFMRNKELREIVERDYQEIQRCYSAQCWKSVILLSGALVSGILIDLLVLNKEKIKTASKTPPDKPDIRSWNLLELIGVCEDLKFIKPGVKDFHQFADLYGKISSLAAEVRYKPECGEAQATTAMKVLDVMHRALSRK
jgi:hypothetical protein